MSGVMMVVIDRARVWKYKPEWCLWFKVPLSRMNDPLPEERTFSETNLRSTEEIVTSLQHAADGGARVWYSESTVNVYTKKFQRLWTFNHPVVVYPDMGVAINKKGKVVLNRNNPKMWRKRCEEELRVYDAAVAKKAAEARECERAFEELLTEANDEMCKVAVREACAACEHKTATVKTPLGDVNFNIGIGRCRPRATYFDGHTTYDLGVRSVNIGGLVRDGRPPATIKLEGWIEGERKPPVSASNPVFDRDTLMREMMRSPMFLHR